MGLQLVMVAEASLQLLDLTKLLPPAMKTESPQTREAVLGELLRRERMTRWTQWDKSPRVPGMPRWWSRLMTHLREDLEMETTWEMDKTFTLYVTCKRRLGSKLDNPYKDDRTGFHVTFYEKILPGSQDGSSHGIWKTGTLYKKPNTLDKDKDVRNFRQCAFSVLAVKSTRPWKIWLLSHSDFAALLSWSTEEKGKLQIRLQSLQNGKIAELACIVWALKEVANRWADLNDYIAELLSDDFMDPESYVKLLSDDAAFRRSKLYFWVIGCLNEFDISIKDNINQWDLFKEKRYGGSGGASMEVPEPGSSNSKNSDPEPPSQQELLQEADEIRGSLENLRSQFRHQLETAKALRDGLFNASALIESRASTRLAETVKLLTYVSLFYLPLAFCAALWAIPNITDKGTRNPFIITAVIVGFVTYAIVFNLDNIARLCSKVYIGRRTRLVDQMQHNSKSPYWRERGASLEVFQPSEDHRTASEWWVVAYQVRRWARQVKCWIKTRSSSGQDNQSNAGAQREKFEATP